MVSTARLPRKIDRAAGWSRVESLLTALYDLARRDGLLNRSRNEYVYLANAFEHR